jgi:hypothetical protein
MTIRWVRTSRASAKKIPQALGWAKEVAAFAEKKFGIDEIRVSMAMVGDLGLIRWETDYADLKAFEEKMSAVMADQDYWALIHKAMSDELFIDGTGRDEIFKQI